MQLSLKDEESNRHKKTQSLGNYNDFNDKDSHDSNTINEV